MSERWMPEIGEIYYFISSSGDVLPDIFDNDNPIKETRCNRGNCFPDQDIAEAAAKKFKAFLLSLYDNETSTANSETLKGTFTEYLKKCAEIQADVILQKARERRLSEQYHNDPEGTKLPEWVEVGGYVYDARNGYGKIVSGSIKSCYIEFDSGAGDFVPEAFADLKQARLRPYNAEEMKALVGQVLKHDTGNYLVTAFENRWNQVKIESVWREEDELVKLWTKLDGQPCGVLEHLENGEWVR